jgi:hypothetical protein
MKEFYSALKPFVNHKTQWDAFVNVLEHYCDEYQRLLEQSSDSIDIHRAQGSVAVIKKMKKLREHVNASDSK